VVSVAVAKLLVAGTRGLGGTDTGMCTLVREGGACMVVMLPNTG